MAEFLRSRLAVNAKALFEDAAKSTADIAKLLRQAKFTVQSEIPIRGRKYDLLATRSELGRLKRYAIDIKVTQKPVSRSFVIDSMQVLRDKEDVDELWLIANAFSGEAHEAATRWRPETRLFTFEEFERMISGEQRPNTQSSRATGIDQVRTVIGKTVFQNREPILLASTALIKLIDDRLSTLRSERPNSDDRMAQLDRSIAEYEMLRSNLDALVESIKKFEKDAGAEKAVVKTTKTLADGLTSWWTTGHEKICDKVYDLGLFGSAVAICSMAGSGGKLAVLVSAALVGGKQVADVAKQIVKKITL